MKTIYKVLGYAWSCFCILSVNAVSCYATEFGYSSWESFGGAFWVDHLCRELCHLQIMIIEHFPFFLFHITFFFLLFNCANILWANLNRKSDSENSCFLPESRGKALRFSPFSIMLGIGLSWMVFIRLR